MKIHVLEDGERVLLAERKIERMNSSYYAFPCVKLLGHKIKVECLTDLN
jgi:hypothetical protein